MIQTIAQGLEWSYGWETAAAQRLRFVLDFAYATGLRASELVGATLGMLDVDAHDDHWMNLVGKGSKPGKVVLPPLARASLDRYLVQRGLPTTPRRWDPATPLVGNLDLDAGAGITASRLWAIMKRFFQQVAELIEEQSPATADMRSCDAPARTGCATHARHPRAGARCRAHHRARQPAACVARDDVDLPARRGCEASQAVGQGVRRAVSNAL